MKNGLNDLNNHLFEQLERLGDDEIMSDKDAAEKEVLRTDAMIKIAHQILENGKLQLEVLELTSDYERKPAVMPDLLKLEKK